MTRSDLFALAAVNDWDAARVESALRAWFATPDGQAALARSPRVYDDATGQMRSRTAEEAALELLGEVAIERRRRGL